MISSKRCCLPVLILVVAGCKRHEAPVPPAPGENAIAGVAYELPVEPLPVGGYCALDAIGGQPAAKATSVKAGGTTVFAGWLGDATGQVPGGAQLVLVDEGQSYSFDIRAGAARSDVAKALNLPGLEMSGYNAELSIKDIAAGSYVLSIVTLGKPTASQCPLNVTLTIEP